MNQDNTTREIEDTMVKKKRVTKRGTKNKGGKIFFLIKIFHLIRYTSNWTKSKIRDDKINFIMLPTPFEFYKSKQQNDNDPSQFFIGFNGMV